MKQLSKNAALLLAAMTVSLTACSRETEAVPESQSPEIVPAVQAETFSVTEPDASVETALYYFDASSLFSDRDLSGSYEETAVITLDGTSAEIDGSGALIGDSFITVTDEGVYRLTGEYTGQIVVNSEGKVQLVLDNARITCPDSSAIYVENAKKVFITLAEGSENSVSDGADYAALTEDRSEPDAAIFSRDSLTINGSGSLTVTGNDNEGITSKDDLVVCNATLAVSAAGNGIKGKDYVAVTGADISVSAGGDGIKSSNAADEGMGFVYIADGSISVDAKEDGIQAESELVICGGDIAVMAGGGTANAELHTNDFGMGGGFGRGGWFGFDDTEETTEESVSVKGLKAGSLLRIEGGTLDIEAADDALHSNGDLAVLGGDMTIRAGSKGLHADGDLTVSEGSVTVSESYEGIEAKHILISGGEISVTSSDDGFNASDGSQQGSMGGAVDCSLEISGGSVYVNAEGDGLDSNGTMLVSGGTVLVDGPTNSGNGALDGNSSIRCTGGLLIAAGSSGMAEYPEGSQNSIVLTTASFNEDGTLVTICDSSGTELLSYAPSKSWNYFIVSSPDLRTGETYTVYLGGNSTALQINGLYETGGYQNNGTEEGAVTIEDAVSFIGNAGGMGGRMVWGGKGGHQMPDDGWNRNDFDPGNYDRGDFEPGESDFGDWEFPTDENGNAVQPDFRGGRFPEGMQPGENGGTPPGHHGGRSSFPGGNMQNS